MQHWYVLTFYSVSIRKSVTGLQISSCGHVLVSSSADGCVIQWDIHSKQSTKMQINKSERMCVVYPHFMCVCECQCVYMYMCVWM